MISHGLLHSAKSTWRRPVNLVVVAGSCLLMGALAAPAQAATDTLYAAPVAVAVGTGDCGAPADACTIADAVTSANAKPVGDGVRIVLAGGTYALTTPTPTALAITFAGPSLTLEAAGGGTPILDGGNATRLLSVDPASTVTIDGLEIRSGSASAPGGAISNNGSLTIRRTTLANNVGSNGGAIANNPGAALDVQDSTLADNSATGVGGGAIIAMGATTVERSALVGNSAPVNGGAVNVQPTGTATVTSSTLAGNTSGSLGGAFSNLGTLTVQASTIKDNTASGGGAVATGNANVTFAASIIAAQAAPEACNPANSAIVDAGYNLDTDGTCVSAGAPAVGSHGGPTANGASTYAAVLDAYLADALAANGGPSRTFALLNRPSPATTLPNPALAAVPASFALPVAVGGVSTACALPDQRGVVPVAGAGCAIGAYLLQETKTVVTAPAGVANAPVTLTATITPAADGGTVAFDDGGGPATTRCAAQSVANGTATCTVTYATAGRHPVTATYTGDGESNNYVGSTSPAADVTVTDPPPAAAPPTPAAPAAPKPAAPDRTSPRTTLRRVSTVTQPITLRGTATDASGIRRVRVSVARHVGKLCRFLKANGTFSKARDCDRTLYVDAKGGASWSLKLPVLTRARYTVWTRGIDTAGNVERKRRGQNLLVVTVAQRSATHG
jgi:hypothetical protein